MIGAVRELGWRKEKVEDVSRSTTIGERIEKVQVLVVQCRRLKAGGERSTTDLGALCGGQFAIDQQAWRLVLEKSRFGMIDAV